MTQETRTRTTFDLIAAKGDSIWPDGGTSVMTGIRTIESARNVKRQMDDRKLGIERVTVVTTTIREAVDD